jgi:hypothetical protein
MAEVPVVIQAIIYPKDKSGDPYPATIAGFARIAGLEVGGGPIIPPDGIKPPQPPLEIWPPPGPLPHPEHPIVLPDPPPVDPPNPPTSTQPVKPNAWNWNDGSNPANPNTGWYYVYVPDPAQGQPGPKRAR